MSDLVPPNQKVDTMNHEIRGFYGKFQLGSSFAISYLQTVIPIRDINILKTANDAYDATNLDFEQILQRDIDPERVENIADNYLKGTDERVLFFPPLLASIVPVDNRIVKEQFENLSHDVGDGILKSTWGDSRFRLEIPTQKESTNFQYEANGETYNSNPHWSMIKLNPSKVSLVVIDGQHRLKALKHLYEHSDQKDRVEKISIPVCILFSPDAVPEKNKMESINVDLRELFVTINNTAKGVSGHFITLLNDRSLTSFSIRSFCDECKDISLSSDVSVLNLIEWNQRENIKASQTNRRYSITTIQIIADTLKKFAFDSNDGSTKTLLNLLSISDKLGEEPIIDDIAEDNFSLAQAEVLKKQIGQNFAKGLACLFTKPRPYKERIDAFSESIGTLNNEMGENIQGAKTFHDKVLLEFRDTNKFDSPEVKDSEKRFEESVKITKTDSIFFNNVFQQGFVRFWLDLSTDLASMELSPLDCAMFAVGVSNDLIFKQGMDIFSSDRSYGQKLLFSGIKILVGDRAKRNWHRLIYSNLLNAQARKIIAREAIKLHSKIDVDTLYDKLHDRAEKYLSDYKEDLKKVVRRDFENNWREKIDKQERIMEIESLLNRVAEGNSDADQEWDNFVSLHVDELMVNLSEKLEGSLGM